MKTEIRNSISGLFLIPLVLACFAGLPSVQSAPDPAPPPPSNTRDGQGSMAHITTGINNSAFGTNALNSLTTGNNNAAQGNSALFSLIDGGTNTALGGLALRFNVHGDNNTAVGYRALESNTTSVNTAVGYLALASNTTGAGNVAVGALTLTHGITTATSTAVGYQALRHAAVGPNDAFGYQALTTNSGGVSNCAIGSQALFNVNTGSHNTALGFQAGAFVTSASGVVCIGAGTTGAFPNVNNTTYIRNVGSTIQPTSAGVVDFVTVRLSDNRLGHTSSSLRYKEGVKPMDKASELIYQLKPVTYRFKKDIEPSQNLDYGLIAEDVAKIDPTLAIRDGHGHIESVRYMAIYNMMLNEFLKEHRKNEEQEATIARQQRQIEALTAGLQKVYAQVEMNRAATQMAENNR
jgi:hypothetical protein